ncbi:MAG: hypothetical protein ACLGHN_12090 [Bacteriovoracia bacterium]
MSFRPLVISLLLSLPIGCTHFHTGRTYLTEMEQDDSSFFTPRNDFPVVAGDTGRYWMSERERKARTPASEDEMRDDLAGRTLKRELRELESVQTEENFEFYNQYQHKLSTISEKIYFLRLPPYERREYLLSRGFLSDSRAPAFSDKDRVFAVRQQNILLGMTKGDVLESWGKPLRVEVAGNPRNENERWLYRMNGASKFIYFESGQVQGWD